MRHRRRTRIKKGVAHAELAQVESGVAQGLFHRSVAGIIPPALPVKICQGYATPLDVSGEFPIQYLHVHHDRAGLLYLSNSSQRHILTKAGNELSLSAQAAQVASGISARQHKKYPCRPDKSVDAP